MLLVHIYYADGESGPSSTIEYDLHSNSTHVCITCVFKSSTPTSCLVVVHQRISQLSSSGLMNIESSHKFNRSGNTAEGCIRTNLKEHQVGVVDGKLVVDVPQEGKCMVYLVTAQKLIPNIVLYSRLRM
jgi:hypothetical protein